MTTTKQLLMTTAILLIPSGVQADEVKLAVHIVHDNAWIFLSDTMYVEPPTPEIVARVKRVWTGPVRTKGILTIDDLKGRSWDPASVDPESDHRVNREIRFGNEKIAGIRGSYQLDHLALPPEPLDPELVSVGASRDEVSDSSPRRGLRSAELKSFTKGPLVYEFSPRGVLRFELHGFVEPATEQGKRKLARLIFLGVVVGEHIVGRVYGFVSTPDKLAESLQLPRVLPVDPEVTLRGVPSTYDIGIFSATRLDRVVARTTAASQNCKCIVSQYEGPSPRHPITFSAWKDLDELLNREELDPYAIGEREKHWRIVAGEEFAEEILRRAEEENSEAINRRLPSFLQERLQPVDD